MVFNNLKKILSEKRKNASLTLSAIVFRRETLGFRMKLPRDYSAFSRFAFKLLEPVFHHKHKMAKEVDKGQVSNSDARSEKIKSPRDNLKNSSFS